MTIFTEETLISALITLAEKTNSYFSLTVDAGGYSIWATTGYVKTANLGDGLLWAYKRLARVAKDQGLEIVDLEVSL